MPDSPLGPTHVARPCPVVQYRGPSRWCEDKMNLLGDLLVRRRLVPTFVFFSGLALIAACGRTELEDGFDGAIGGRATGGRAGTGGAHAGTGGQFIGTGGRG